MMVQLEAPMEATLAALRVAREEGVLTLLNTAPAKDRCVQSYCAGLVSDVRRRGRSLLCSGLWL